MTQTNPKPKIMVENISCVLPQESHQGGLFVGNMYGAQNSAILKQYGVRAVLTTSIQTDINFNHQDIPFHMKIEAHDKENYSLRQHINQCIHFIQQARKLTNVYVHCFAGVSRSVAIVCAYIMWKFKWNYQTTIAFVKAKRIVAKPNDGFVRQLLEIQQILLETSYYKKPQPINIASEIDQLSINQTNRSNLADEKTRDIKKIQENNSPYNNPNTAQYQVKNNINSYNNQTKQLQKQQYYTPRTSNEINQQSHLKNLKNEELKVVSNNSQNSNIINQSPNPYPGEKSSYVHNSPNNWNGQRFSQTISSIPSQNNMRSGQKIINNKSNNYQYQVNPNNLQQSNLTYNHNMSEKSFNTNNTNNKTSSSNQSQFNNLCKTNGFPHKVSREANFHKQDMNSHIVLGGTKKVVYNHNQIPIPKVSQKKQFNKTIYSPNPMHNQIYVESNLYNQNHTKESFFQNSSNSFKSPQKQNYTSKISVKNLQSPNNRQNIYNKKYDFRSSAPSQGFYKPDNYNIEIQKSTSRCLVKPKDLPGYKNYK